MRHRRAMLCTAFVAVVMLVAIATPASAAIRINKIAFDPPGADTGLNKSLNQEWILLKNTGAYSKDLDGWKLVDRGPDHRYRFNVSLPGGDLLKLHSGQGTHKVTSGCGGTCSVHHYYWGLDNYVWNNDGDRAALKKPSGTVADRCAYTDSADSPKAC